MRSPINSEFTGSTRLGGYSLTAAAFLCLSQSSEAQILYTDLSPDVFIADFDTSYSIDTSMLFDLNGDGIDDLRIRAQIGKNYTIWGASGATDTDQFLSMEPLGSNEIMQLDPAVSYAPGALVSYSLPMTAAPQQILYRHKYLLWGSGGVWTSGYGRIGTDLHFGIKLEVGSNTHFGWFRLQPTDFSEGYLKDFAINLTPGAPIITGQNGDSISIVATDVSNFGTPEDLGVYFVAADETVVSEYRLFAVPDSMHAGFDLAAALSSTAYLSVIPAGAPFYNINFLPTSNDAFGNPIQQGVNYRVFILTKGLTDAIHGPSNLITLNTLLTGVTGSVVASVSSDLLTATTSDFSLHFAPVNFTDVSEYKIALMPVGPAPAPSDFYSLAADQVLTHVATDPNPISLNLGGIVRDVNGDTIVHDGVYRAAILSAAIPPLDSVVNLSWNFTVNWSAPAAAGFVVLDVDDTGTSMDLGFKFNTDPLHAGLDEFWLWAVPSSMASSVASDAAIGIYPPNHLVLDPTDAVGSWMFVSLPACGRDAFGNTIAAGINYTPMVLAKGNVGFVDRLSITPSSGAFDSGTPAVTGVSAINSFASEESSSLTVDFTGPFDSTVDLYRLFLVVPEMCFDSADIVSAVADAYTPVPAIGIDGSTYTETLLPDSKDIFGNDVIPGEEYQILIAALSNAPGGTFNLEGLAFSDEVYRLALIAAPPLAVADIGEEGNGSDLEISFTTIDSIAQYKVFAVRQDLLDTVFDFADALTEPNFIAMPDGLPTGLATNFSPDKYVLSTDGSYFGNGIPYRFYLLATIEGWNNLSPPTEQFLLADPEMEAVPLRFESNTIGTQIYFSPAIKFDHVDYYKVLLIPQGEPVEMYLSQIDALNSDHFVEAAIAPAGEFVGSLWEISKDINGNDITTGVNYEALILTKGLEYISYSNGYTLVRSSFGFDPGLTVGLETNAIAEVDLIVEGTTLYLTNAESISIGQIQIFNSAGQLVKLQAAYNSGIDLHGFSSGNYILLILTSDGYKKGRFTIEK